ncbi:carbonic anhydrase [Leptolyngbya sp. FACHB-321]|uniref:carbonic anhydrase n=1 Tax=Leptolyngbya sp. FACHB-321 TaxID=2692807 RepID=UPI0018F054A1|nr:carbonic anhydrase [Leptolyngbya sp. FACHB-321]
MKQERQDFRERFIDRRDFLKQSASSTASLLVAASTFFWRSKQAQAAELAPTTAQPLKPEAALQKLMAGNQRFRQHHPQYPDQSAARLQAVSQAQHPFATILSCADSRVPVELIFDQGVGDIFDVRIAGNIATPEVIGSIEYAIVLLDTPVLMVLGHERCGAVTAAVNSEVLPGAIGSLVKAILPAIEPHKAATADLIDTAVLANVRYQIAQLKRSPLLAERLQAGTLKIVGGRYDLDAGSVTLLT